MVNKILVTGGNGYIGSRLCLYLAGEGYAVTPVCYPVIPSDDEWIAKMDRVVVGDIRDESFLTKLSEYGYDVIVHLVSLDHRQSDGEPSFVASVNVTPTWVLLDLFSKKRLKKFIYFSTVQVYGKLPNVDITEQYRPYPLNRYGLTHFFGEQLCELYNRTTSVACRVVRLSNSYGAPVFVDNNCWWLVVNDLCRQAYVESMITLQSDGTPQRDFIHGWDVCQAVEKIISTNQLDFVYQISSGITLTISEIAQCVQRMYEVRYGRLIQINKGDAGELVSDNERYHIDNSLLRSIGFDPKWNLELGINDIFNFLERSNEKRESPFFNNYTNL